MRRAPDLAQPAGAWDLRGLPPCPSALLALLGAVAVGRAGFGLLVVAFSLGLAATLTGVGLLFLYAGRFLKRRESPGDGPASSRFAPAPAAVAVTASGRDDRCAVIGGITSMVGR